MNLGVGGCWKIWEGSQRNGLGGSGVWLLDLCLMTICSCVFQMEPTDADMLTITEMDIDTDEAVSKREKEMSNVTSKVSFCPNFNSIHKFISYH